VTYVNQRDVTSVKEGLDSSTGLAEVWVITVSSDEVAAFSS